MIAAILRAQFLSMRIRAGSRGSSAVFSVITGLLYYGFWCVVSLGLMAMFSAPSPEETLVTILSIVFLLGMLYWQFAPLLTASYGASLDLRKLLAYPVPPGKLFAVELLLRVTTCVEMLILIIGVSAGFMRNPAYGLKSAPLIVSGALSFAVLNIFVSGGTRLLIERWFRTSRWREIVFLAFLALCVAPQFLIRTHIERKLIVRLTPSQFFWPWAAPARLMLGDHAASAGLAAMVWLAAAYAFSRRQFLRSLRYDSSEQARPERDLRPGSLAQRLFRLPSRFLADPLAALVEKELRTLSRIARVRIVFVMSCGVGLIFFFPQLGHPRHVADFIAENALPVIAVYGLLLMAQVSYWNSFGFDRSAAMGYFCWPIRMRDVFIAKNIAVALILLPEIAIVWTMAALFRLPASPTKFIEAVVVMVAASLYWFGVGNIFSVRLPRPMDPDKMNQMSGKLQALSTLAAPLLLLPIVLAYITRAVFESQLAFVGVMAIAILIGGIVYYVCLDSAVEAAYRRRETLLNDLSRMDGPISIT